MSLLYKYIHTSDSIFAGNFFQMFFWSNFNFLKFSSFYQHLLIELLEGMYYFLE